MITYKDIKKHEKVIGNLPLIPLELTSGVAQNVGEWIEYKGIKLRWSGFLAQPDSEIIVCRWFAWFRLDKKIMTLVSMSTGSICFYEQGSYFNTEVKQGFERYCYLENLLSWPEDIQGAKEKTLQMLKDAIDFNWDIIKPEAGN